MYSVFVKFSNVPKSKYWIPIDKFVLRLGLILYWYPRLIFGIMWTLSGSVWIVKIPQALHVYWILFWVYVSLVRSILCDNLKVEISALACT